MVTYSEDRIIDIKNKDYEMYFYFLGIDIRIKDAYRKLGVKKKSFHFGILSSRSFLNTIKIFLKATNKARVILDIARRLFHVDFFLQIPM
jgi:hypothetical protein